MYRVRWAAVPYSNIASLSRVFRTLTYIKELCLRAKIFRTKSTV